MDAPQVVNATEFKAKCLDILDRLGESGLERIYITKRGRVVGVLTPPENAETAVQNIHGFMRGSVVIPGDVDLTAPVLDEPFSADEGRLHG
jgi:antitoxin (DNA-binding transcriptional repressor) of toxin-antitoxin stability system